MKPDLLILHGALGGPSQFQELSSLLSSQFSVHVVPFDGHEGLPIEAPYSIDLFARNLKDYCTYKRIDHPFVFGYSMGGYVALLAAHQGFRLARLLTLGTKFAWNPDGAAKEIRQLQPEIIEVKVPQFAAYQSRLHHPLNWKDVMNGTAAMMNDLGKQPALSAEILSRLTFPTLCCLGDEDAMVSREETRWAADCLANGQIRILHDMPHPIEKVNLPQLVEEIQNWFLR